MNTETTDTPPPLLKVVGRRPPGGNPLRRLQRLNTFIYRHAHDATSDGELFPVRKSVELVRARVDS